MRPSKSKLDSSFGAFMDQAGPALLRTAWFLTGDADHAQELTQAAFVKTYVVWHKIDHDRALAYTRRCLVNHKIDVWRATRHEVADLTCGLELAPASRGSASATGSESFRSFGSSSPDRGVATTDHRDDLVRRLSRLPEQQRKVVVLRYYADQSEAAVADALGISVGSVKSAASRGLAALRRHAEDENESEAKARTNAQSHTNAQAQTQAHPPIRNANPTTEGSLR
jgi:RNA polymerase sigma-70 factor (sigma-E family)